jgi:TetR/AcrR family transcriptional regulator
VSESNIPPKKESIITAAHRRFAHYGYSKTTMDEIAGDLGMGKASLYHYFPTKESLFCAVLEEEQNSFILQAGSLVDGDAPAGEILHAYADRRLDFFRTALILGKFSPDAYLSIKPAMSTIMEKFARRELGILAGVFRRGIAQGDITGENTDQVATLFLHILQGLRMRVFRFRTVEPVDDAVFDDLRTETHLATTVLLRGLHPRAAGSPLHAAAHSR